MSSSITCLASLLSFIFQMQNALTADVSDESLSGEEIRPVIAFDQGHDNWGRTQNLSVFRDFLSENGFQVEQITGPVTMENLEHIDVFHTTNALAIVNKGNWALPTPPAFTPAEICILREWVHKGGALLIAIEHMPFPGAYVTLAAAFGIEVSNGFAVDGNLLDGYSEDIISRAGFLVFERESGALANHPILDGPKPYSRVGFLATDTGSAFRLPDQALSLITFGSNVLSLEPEVSWEFDDETIRKDVTGWSQAGILEVGQGRVAVLGDNFLINAPAYLEPPYVESDQEAELGAFNHQFTLNLYRWLTRYQPK
jgi:hypothetical protein